MCGIPNSSNNTTTREETVDPRTAERLACIHTLCKRCRDGDTPVAVDGRYYHASQTFPGLRTSCLAGDLWRRHFEEMR